MLKDDVGKLFYIKESEENRVKIDYLVDDRNDFLWCKKVYSSVSQQFNETWLISDTVGFYKKYEYGEGEWFQSALEIRTDSYEGRKVYRPLSSERIEFESFLLLLSLNNLLKKDIEEIKKIIDDKFEKYKENRENNGIYYEFIFTESEKMKFYMEYGKTAFAITIDHKNGYLSFQFPGMNDETDDLRPWNADNTLMTKKYQEYFMFALNHTIKEIKNGIIVDDIYYVDIESAIYDIMEKEKK